MNEIGQPIFDGDNHYYEALDAFTRHLDPKLGPRVVQWCEIGGRSYHVVGGRVNHAVVNPTFNPVSPAGSMAAYFRGNPEGKDPREMLGRPEVIRPEYRDRDARLTTMTSQGVDQIWLFPTLGVLYEEPLKHDPQAVGMMTWAFNRWMEEDWGFAYRDRIFAAPYISLADLPTAIAQLEWALGRGARVICMRAAAPTTTLGQFSPGDPRFDPFWARVNEAGITVVIHAGDAGNSSNGYAADGFSSGFGGSFKPSIKSFAIERAAYDFLISMLFDGVFTRFPHVRIASIENGAEFLPDLFRKLASMAKKMPWFFSESPTEQFKRNVWINPFWEDNIDEVVAQMGADRVIFGSDWPHIEGLPNPRDYESEIAHLAEADQRRILHGNVSELNTLRPA